jgi:hypothetical protein
MTWAGGSVLGNTGNSETILLSDSESRWDAVEGEIHSRVGKMQNRLEELHSRLPQLNQRLEELHARLPELSAKVERAMERARARQEAARKAMEVSRESLEKSFEKLRELQPVAPVGVIAMADWDRGFKGEVAEEEIKEEFPAAKDSALVINTEFATVDVRAEDRESIVVQGLRKAGGDTQEEAREYLESVDLSVKKKGNGIHITGGLKRKKHETSRNDYRRIQITVLLPSYVKTNIKNKFGSVEVKGLQADLEIKNGFARTLLENTTGILEVQNEFSDITVSQHAGGGKVRGNFGKLVIDGWSGPLDVRSSYAPTKLSNLTVTDDINIKNEFAPIVLHLKEGINAVISAKTSFGKIQCDFPIEGKKTGTELKAQLGEGGPSIEISNQFSDIHLAGKEVKVSKVSLTTESSFEGAGMPSIPAVPHVEIPQITIPEINIPPISIPAIPAPPQHEDRETYAEEWTIPLEDLGKIDTAVIEHDHGDISVIGSESGPYEIRAKKRIWAESEERAKGVADQFSLEASYSRSTLKLESRRPDRLPPGVKGASVDYTVIIPTNMELRVNADHGNFEARDTKGDVEIEHDHGNVKLESIRGKITSTSDHGNLEASDITGDVEIKHDHGNVNLRSITGKVTHEGDHGNLNAEEVTSELVTIEQNHGKVELKNISGRVTCSTTHGDTMLDDAPGPLHLEYGHGNARILAERSLQGEWRIDGTRGHCYVVLPPKAGVNLSLDASNGSIKTSRPIEVERERRHESCKAELNGGGTPVTIAVHQGNITVE